MKVEILHTPKNECDKAMGDIEDGIGNMELEPNFMLMFLTAGSFKDWKRYNEFFRKHFPDVEMLGCVVEGYAAGDEIWTRGIVVLLGEFEGHVKVYFERGNNVEDVCWRLGARIGSEYDSILAMFPVVYFSGRLELARMFLNDRLYYRRYRGQSTVEGKKEVLREYSRYLEDHLFFPIDKVLKHLSENTGRRTPIIGMNLMPMEAKIGTPLIIANYEEVGRGVAAMCFKGEVNAVYHDIYPERGNSFEETVEIIKNYFSNVEEVKTVKAGIAIGEINEMPPMEFLREKRRGFDEVDEEKFLKKVEDGKLQTVSPYGLSFISKKYFSSFLLGLVNSPVSIYPSFVELDHFRDECFFHGETFKGGPKKFAEIVKNKKTDGFDLIFFDMDMIPSFRGEIYKTLEEIKKYSSFRLGVFTSPPSAFIPNLSSKALIEVEQDIFVTSSGSNALLEFK